MSVRGAIYTLLSGLESSTYPLVAPQKTTSTYAVFHLSKDKVRSQDGNELKVYKMRLEIYGNDYDSVATLAATFEADLDLKDETVIGAETLMVSYMDMEDDDFISNEEKYNITQEYTLKFY